MTTWLPLRLPYYETLTLKWMIIDFVHIHQQKKYLFIYLYIYFGNMEVGERMNRDKDENKSHLPITKCINRFADQ